MLIEKTKNIFTPVRRKNIHDILPALMNPGQGLHQTLRRMNLIHLIVHHTPGMNRNQRHLPLRNLIMLYKFNTAILFITHDLGIISKMCDRVAVMYSGRIVEYGNKRSLFSKGLHPYTKKLISSVPIVGKRRESLEIIPGSVPNLIYPPSGCRFHPRCDFRFEPCDKIIPKRIEIENNYFVCCHLYDPEFNSNEEGIN